MPDITKEQIHKNANKDIKKKHIYLILDGDEPIGDLSITIDAPHLKKKEENTGWISICIGEGDYRGKGVAHEAMIFLEEECKALGLKRIELGVFEYNQRARTFYEKMGYETFERIEDFVYFDGKWHADIRMEKYL